jgi:hypothetical protein
MDGGVVEADSVAEQYWDDVNVDFVDETEAQQLSANVRREDAQLLAAGGLKPDSDGFLHGAVEEGDVVSGARVLGMVRENEDWSLPCAAVGS